MGKKCMRYDFSDSKWAGTKELSLWHKLWFSNHYIFATQCRSRKTMNSVRSNVKLKGLEILLLWQWLIFLFWRWFFQTNPSIWYCFYGLILKKSKFPNLDRENCSNHLRICYRGLSINIELKPKKGFYTNQHSAFVFVSMA